MNAKFHFSLDVENIRDSISFYSTLLGIPASKQESAYAQFDHQPALSLSLQEKTHCCLQGLKHIGLQVQTVNEVQAIRNRLESAGHPVADKACCSPDKFCLRDPTGYRWQVYI
jgi:predicted enzyme related to lactoylglutathione lyase